jgi:hypothetical protein
MRRRTMNRDDIKVTIEEAEGGGENMVITHIPTGCRVEGRASANNEDLEDLLMRQLTREVGFAEQGI